MEDHFGHQLLGYSYGYDTRMRFQSRSLMDHVDGRIYHAYFVICHYQITESALVLYDPPSFPLLDQAHLVIQLILRSIYLILTSGWTTTPIQGSRRV